MKLLRFCAALAAASLVNACSAEPPSASEHGRELFESGALSPSRLNVYSCASCHDARPQGEASLLKPGAPLAGVTRRTSFWGGQESSLLRSVNACRAHFMVANLPLAAADPDAEALYAFLVSLEPGDATPVAFSVVRSIDALPRGDATRGEPLYTRACLYCHGLAHSGAGRLSARVPILPEETIEEHADLSSRVQRLVFIEKIRHGGFLGYGGDMPPFSQETLHDQQVADVLEWLGVLGE